MNDDTYRNDPTPTPELNIGPVACRDCVYGREQPPLDCVLVPVDARYRSIQVVHRRWTAEERGCPDFTPHPEPEHEPEREPERVPWYRRWFARWR